MHADQAMAVRGLEKHFRRAPWSTAVTALAGVDFAVAAGEVLGLVGPNGSGKTTAIRCALGLARPTAGRALLFGAPAAARARRGDIGYSPEQFELKQHRSGREVLELLLALSGVPRAERRRRAGAALEQLGLRDAADRGAAAYSKGMLRRLSIAAALQHDPRLVVLDEPFDGLDPLGSAAVRDEIASRARAGAAVLVSSHDLAELESVASHLLVLDRGRPLEHGAIGDVLTRRGRATLEVEGLDAAALDALCRFAREQGAAVAEAHPARETLEQMFRRRVRGGGPGA